LKQILETALSAEAETHIAETKSAKNRHNGKGTKTVRSSVGSFELDTPRDRNSSFQP